jgi:hypothetical protein
MLSPDAGANADASADAGADAYVTTGHASRFSSIIRPRYFGPQNLLRRQQNILRRPSNDEWIAV